ncbi:MAG TPA: GntR family transcriptional regulator [Acidobacteriota bacterium]
MQFRAGIPVHQQVVYAVKKAIVSRQIQPGDSFPSVRQLSQELKINPNTAHKIVGTLINEGLLEVRPGIGTIVGKAPAATRIQRSMLLKQEAEHLVVEARNLALELEDVLDAIRKHWNHLGG